MLDLSKLDIDAIATALTDQTDFDHHWLIDPHSGEIAFWTSDTGIDGSNPVDLDEVDLLPIEPLPPSVWYRDMVDFAVQLSDDATRLRLERALEGRGAFRRFKDELYGWHPDLVGSWHAFRDARAERRAVEWLGGEGLIPEDAVERFGRDHPDPAVP